MCVEARSVAEALLQLYEAQGLKQLMTEYLGELRCLSEKNRFCDAPYCRYPKPVGIRMALLWEQI
jgi:hypothetical protein